MNDIQIGLVLALAVVLSWAYLELCDRVRG
jgi:hypothetical protein